MAAPKAWGSSWARDWIGAPAAATLDPLTTVLGWGWNPHCNSNPGSQPTVPRRERRFFTWQRESYFFVGGLFSSAWPVRASWWWLWVVSWRSSLCTFHFAVVLLLLVDIGVVSGGLWRGRLLWPFCARALCTRAPSWWVCFGSANGVWRRMCVCSARGGTAKNAPRCFLQLTLPLLVLECSSWFPPPSQCLLVCQL